MHLSDSPPNSGSRKSAPGRRKITHYTRYATVLLATFQSFGIAVMLFKQPNLVVTSQFEFYLTTVVTLVTGTMFLMWLGEQITERGIGNGIWARHSERIPR